MSVIFDQLRVSDDGKRMYISIHVNRASYFDDIYLDEIVITTADKVLETSPTIPSEDYIYKKVFDNGMKEADIVLLPTDFNEHFTKSNFSSDLFFVYVKVKGTPDPCTPCRLDEEVTLGVTFDESLLYQQVMQFTKSLAEDCNIPVGFTDFILKWNAFKAAVETEHYIPAINYYQQLFDNTVGISAKGTSKPCGCHG
jgi:hypothetical protein